jgi:hypothetical protein
MADEQDSAYDFAPREEPKADPAPPLPTRTPARENKPAVRPERVAPEMVCPHCGLEIFKKPRSGRCPECAAPLDVAGTGLLQFADGEWLGQLSNGILLFALALLLDIGGIAFTLAGFPHSGDLVHLIAAATAAYGLFRATTPESGIAAEHSPTAAAARITAFTLLGLWVLLSLVAFTHSTGAMKFLTTLVLLTYAVEAPLFALHLQKLAARVPNDSLAAQSLNLAWLMPGVCLALLFAALVRPEGSLKDDPLLMLVFPLLGVLLLMILWALSVLVRLGLELRNAIAAGESIAQRKAQRLAQKK